MGTVTTDLSSATMSLFFEATASAFERGNPQQVSNMLYSLALMGVKSDDWPAEFKKALPAAFTLLRKSRQTNPQAVSNGVGAVAKMMETADCEHHQHDLPLTQMLSAVAKVSGEMIPQGIALTVWSFGKLQVVWSDTVSEALEAAIVRCSDDMNPQDVSNTLLGLADMQASCGESCELVVMQVCQIAIFLELMHTLA